MVRSGEVKNVPENQTLEESEKRYKSLISKILNSGGGVLENVHLRFDEDLFEEANVDTEVEGFRKRKYEELKKSGKKLEAKRKKTTFSEAHEKCERKQNPCPYGNVSGYYKKRIGLNGIDDPRLLLFEEKWFTNKDVMDVGCHEGYIAITLAQMYTVNSMHGVDIDEGLVTRAYKHLEEEAESPSCAAPLVEVNADAVDEECEDVSEFYDAPCRFEENEDDYNLLERVTFETTNFLTYEIEDGCVDTILCLSVTKWVHLNWGDKGLMTLFQKMYSALRTGGVLILEPQGWKSYRKNRKTTDTIHENYMKLTLRPNDFTNILINEVGFKSCEVIARTTSGTEKGFDRPIYLYTK